ncbi:hypothetical protein NF867_12315 [Solitalea sp. MAHUQ-68]|uniref:BioF2-like acetyltransferase domain-containing protein n=1 Tax=Solitalea agri TaxID=2953739 RepID=A0A9X2JDI2_9SPHI|nr:hypothetical protein [Solitalea agri]MCO4293649.1 hypothetical protein [Solitalea agri]
MIITYYQDKHVLNGEGEVKVTSAVSLTCKEEFRILCKQENAIPVFNKDWWLDLVCGEDNWDVVLVEADGIIQGAWPYFIQRKFNHTISKVPALTPFMGVWIRPSTSSKIYKKAHHEKHVCNELINKLPNLSFISQTFGSHFTNWQPFYWKGFHQTVNYSHLIDNILKWKELKMVMPARKQKDLHSGGSVIKTGLPSVHEYQSFKDQCKKRKQQGLSSYSVFNKVYEALKKLDAGEVICCTNHTGSVESLMLVVWDSNSAYTIIWGGKDSNDDSIISMVNKAVDIASLNVNKMEFFGKLSLDNEKVLVKFGANQLPYYSIYKANRFLYRLALFFGFDSIGKI